jgi:hypothetical protein
MSWKAEIIADSSGKWTSNGLRFATLEEARAYGADLYARWAAVRQVRHVECADPVNHSWPDNRPVRPPLPRVGDLQVTVVTDVDQFIREIMGDVEEVRRHGS